MNQRFLRAGMHLAMALCLAAAVGANAASHKKTTGGGSGGTSGGTSGGSTGGTTSTPYLGTPFSLPGMFYAVNFDLGGQGVAYNDLSAGNLGGLYRTSEDVDIYASSDPTGGPYQVGNFQSTEWMNYSVSVSTSGNYDISIYASNNYASSDAFHIEVDGVNVTGSVIVPMTGSWTTYQWVGKQAIPLTAGNHVLKLVADQQWFNVTAISVLASATTTTSGGGTTSTSSTPSSLIFWSGYEGTTALAGPTNCYSNGCWQSITGTDPTTGFTWPPVVNNGTAQFQLLANSAAGSTTSNIGNYMYNQVQTVTGHTGAQTHAMYSNIIQSGCCGTNSQDSQNGSTQEPYMIQPGSDVTEEYISQWVMLQPDLAQVMAAGTWRDLFEWKSSDQDYRIQLSIVNYGGGTPHWQVSADSNIPSYHEFWRVDPTNVAVPMGQWFKLEIYWKRSTGSDGRVWMAINGTVLANQYGANYGPNNSPINRIMTNQLYSGSVYPIYQWIDDLQVWSTFPTAVSGNAWYNPPYAPH